MTYRASDSPPVVKVLFWYVLQEIRNYGRDINPFPLEVSMFSPDDLAPALIALPYVTFAARNTFRGSLRLRLLASRPGYCRYLPWFCNS